MANTTKDLEIRINAIVDGMDEIQAIREQFSKIVDELVGVKDTSQAVQETLSKVGSEGLAAANDLDQLSKQSKILQDAIEGITAAKSLEEIQTQAEGALGSLRDLSKGATSVDEVGKAADEVSQETKDLQDEVNTLIGILGRLSNVESMEDLAEASEDALQAIDKLSRGTDSVSADVQQMDKAFDKAGGSVAEAAKDIGQAEKAFNNSRDALEDFTDAMLQLSQGNKSLEEVKDLSAKAVDALEELSANGVEGFQAVNENVELSAEAVTQFTDTIDDLIDQFQDLAQADSLEDVADYADKSKIALDLTAESVEDLVSELTHVDDRGLNDLNKAANSAEKEVKETTNAVDKLANSTGHADTEASRLQSSAQAMADNLRHASDVASGVADHLEDVADSATDVSDSVAGMNDANSGAVDSSSRLGGAISNLKGFFQGAKDEGGMFVDSVRSITKVGPTVGGALGVVGGAVMQLKDQFGALVAGIAAFVAVASLKEAADTAARVETLGVTMYNVGKNTGYTKDQLDQFEKEVKDMGITTGSARETITQMAAAGLELGSVTEGATSQVAQLARASQDLAVRMGGSSSETLQQMITNIQQLDTEGLRYMGIILDVTKAQEKYATELGVSTGALTQAQKQQAVMNEVLAQSKTMTGLYEESLETVGKKIGSLSRYKETLAETIGAKLLPAYGKLVDNATDYLKDLTKIVENTDKAGTASRNYADAMDGLSSFIMKGFKAAVEVFSEANEGISILFATVGDLLGIFGEMFEAFDMADDSVLSLGKVIGGFATAVAGAFALAIDAAGLLSAAFGSMGGMMMIAVGSIIEGLGQLLDLLPFVGDTVMKVGTNLKQMGKDGVDASGELTEKILAGEGAMGKFNQRVLAGADALKNLKNAATFDQVETEIVKLIEAQRKGEMTSYDLAEAAQVASEKIKQMGSEGKLTELEMNKLQAKIQAINNKELDAFNKALELVGFTAQELRDRTTASFSEVVGGLKELAQNATTTSDVFFAAFDQSIDGAKTINDLYGMVEALESYQDRLKKSGKLTEEESKKIADSVALMKEKFTDLVDNGMDTAKTTEQFARLREDVEKTGKKLVEMGGLTEAELTAKLKNLDQQAKDAGIALENLGTAKGLEKMGIAFDELTTGVDANFKKLLQGLEEVLAEAKLTSEQLRKVFDEAISAADSSQELTLLSEKIKQTFEEGKMDAKDFESSMTDVKRRMAEIFNEAIDTATTRQELEAVKKEFQAMAQQGLISSKDLQAGIDKIKEKLDGAKPSVVELSRQMTELGSQSVNVARAESEAFNKLLQVQEKRNALEQAKLRLSKEDNDENRIAVQLAEKEVQIAEAEYALAQTQAKLERETYDMMISQQKLLNAEKEAGMAIDQAAAQAKVKALQNEVDAKMLSLDATAQTLQLQEKQVIALQQQRAELQAQVQAHKEASAAASETDKAEKKTNQTRSTGSAIAALINGNYARTVQLLREAGFNEDEVMQKAAINREQYLKGLANVLRGGMLGGEMWKMMERQLQDQIAYKKHALELEEREKQLLAEKEQKFNDLVSNAQKLAELGYDANTSWNALAKEGLTSSASLMSRMKATAKEALKAAQDSVKSFMSSLTSIKQEYLEATGQEEAALALRYESRKRELALEYEMLKVQVTAAKIVAKQAGESTAVLDKALKDAEAGYKQSLKYLEEMEKLEQEALKKQKAAEEAEAKAKAAEEAEAARKKSQEDSAEKALTKAFQEALAKTLKSDPNGDGLDDKGQPLHFTFEVNGKKIQATTQDTTEDLMEVLEKMGMRST